MTKFSLDRATFTLTFERLLHASREDVFDAWTRPEELAAWWDPTGRPLVRCEMDVRPGGRFVFVNDGHAPPFEGVYEIVDRPALLVFDALGARGTVRLTAEGAHTRLSVQIRCASAEHLEGFVRHGVADGTAQTLDNLVARFG